MDATETAWAAEVFDSGARPSVPTHDAVRAGWESFVSVPPWSMPMRDVDCFVPGGLGHHSEFWDKVLLEGYPDRERYLRWVAQGVLYEFWMRTRGVRRLRDRIGVTDSQVPFTLIKSRPSIATS